MIALTQEKREELKAFLSASIENRCTVYTLSKQRELEALRDQIALASLTAEKRATVDVVGVIWNEWKPEVGTPLFTNPSIPDINKEDYIGLQVSVDVSTCDSDAGHRYFGRVSTLSESNGEVVLVIEEPEKNFTTPPVPEINLPHELMDLVNAVEFYHAVKAENPKVETGMWKDAYDWIKKAAVEAAPVIKRLNGLGE